MYIEIILSVTETNATNPQFRIRVPTGHPSKAHVVVAVAQKYECYRSRLFEDEQIGFTIYEIPPSMARVTPQYVCDQMPLDYAPLQNTREGCFTFIRVFFNKCAVMKFIRNEFNCCPFLLTVATFFALPAGDFVVMPNSVQHREGKFLLRILADQHASVGFSIGLQLMQNVFDSNNNNQFDHYYRFSK